MLVETTAFQNWHVLLRYSVAYLLSRRMTTTMMYDDDTPKVNEYLSMHIHSCMYNCFYYMFTSPWS